MSQQVQRQREITRTLANGVEENMTGNGERLVGGVADDAQGKRGNTGGGTGGGDPGGFHVHGRSTGGGVEGGFGGDRFGGDRPGEERAGVEWFVGEDGMGSGEEGGFGMVLAQEEVARAEGGIEAARVPGADGEAREGDTQESSKTLAAGGSIADARVTNENRAARELAADGREVVARTKALRVGQSPAKIAAFVGQSEGDEDRRGVIHRRRWDG